MRPKNRQTIQRTGACVWLNAQPQELAKRIHGDVLTAQRRPALTGLSSFDEIGSLLARREPLYQEVSQLKVETDQDPLDNIAQQVERRLAVVR